MSSLTDDRTARARIRDEALTLFATHGADAVTVRAVAAAADVSPALVIRHYGTKDGLREAVDDHVLRVFDAMLATVAQPTDPGTGPFEPAAMPSLADTVAAYLPADSPIPGYLARMLVGGGAAGEQLFARLHALSRAVLRRLVDTGVAVPGADPDVRAAVLLSNDLAMLLLRPHLTTVLGADPLSADGLARWGTELLAIYRDGLSGACG